MFTTKDVDTFMFCFVVVIVKHLKTYPPFPYLGSLMNQSMFVHLVFSSTCRPTFITLQSYLKTNGKIMYIIHLINWIIFEMYVDYMDIIQIYLIYS